jgi:hypothetical protein
MGAPTPPLPCWPRRCRRRPPPPCGTGRRPRAPRHGPMSGRVAPTLRAWPQPPHSKSTCGLPCNNLQYPRWPWTPPPPPSSSTRELLCSDGSPPQRHGPMIRKSRRSCRAPHIKFPATALPLPLSTIVVEVNLGVANGSAEV